jgi:hypothetical protein
MKVLLLLQLFQPYLLHITCKSVCGRMYTYAQANTLHTAAVYGPFVARPSNHVPDVVRCCISPLCRGSNSSWLMACPSAVWASSACGSC